MTVFEALKALGAEYNVSDEIITITLIGRGVDGSMNFEDLDNRLNQLLRLDLLLNIILYSPSTSSSQSVSHGGFQKTMGSRSDAWRKDKLNMIFRMYANLGDDLFAGLQGMVTFNQNPLFS